MKKIKILIAILFVLAILFLNGCEQVCGTHTETYTSGAKGCDKMSNCRCLHYGYGGLGSCDSCECTKEVSNC